MLFPHQAACQAVMQGSQWFSDVQGHAARLVHGGDADALGGGQQLAARQQVLQRVQAHGQDLRAGPAQRGQHRQRVQAAAPQRHLRGHTTRVICFVQVMWVISLVLGCRRGSSGQICD